MTNIPIAELFYLISAVDDTFEGIKLYNSLEQALFSKYANKHKGILLKNPKTEPIANGLEDHGGESILDEEHPSAPPANTPNRHYSQADRDAFIKISKALYKRPVSEKYGAGVDDEHSKKLLNGVLVAQLQSLLDNNRFLSMKDEVAHNDLYSIPISNPKVAPIVNPEPIPIVKASVTPTQFGNVAKTPEGQPKEHLFLVLNEELKTVTHEELIYVDPNSLSEDSTVFVLGGLNDMFSNEELATLVSIVVCFFILVLKLYVQYLKAFIISVIVINGLH